MTSDHHPVRALAHWETSAEEIKKMMALYDALVGSDPARRTMLDTIIGWSRSENSAIEAYNNTDFSGG